MRSLRDYVPGRINDQICSTIRNETIPNLVYKIDDAVSKRNLSFGTNHRPRAVRSSRRYRGANLRPRIFMYLRCSKNSFEGTRSRVKRVQDTRRRADIGSRTADRSSRFSQFCENERDCSPRSVFLETCDRDRDRDRDRWKHPTPITHRTPVSLFSPPLSALPAF